MVNSIFSSENSEDEKIRDGSQNGAKQKKVKEYEYQIDKMVYNLYSLTKREIKVAEFIEKQKKTE